MVIPPWPEGAVATAPLAIRYEDISQDGRMLLEVGPQTLGAVWEELARGADEKAMMKSGIIPILSRLRIVGEDGPFGVRPGLQARGVFALARVDDERGEIDRLVINMWGELTAPIGTTYGPKPPRAGERVVAVRVFAEHTLTRLFAPPGERKVRALPAPTPGAPWPPMPTTVWASPPGERLLDLPDGAQPLGEEALDPAPVSFGVMHTDSNQHVNSLVYLRVFEEAVLRRLRELGRPTTVLSRAVEVVYRKPCFAGEVVRTRLKLFERDGRIGAAGTIVSDGNARPHTFMQMWLA
jgi:hypothetical protein